MTDSWRFQSSEHTAFCGNTPLVSEWVLGGSHTGLLQRGFRIPLGTAPRMVVYNTAGTAIEQAWSEQRPVLLEYKTCRFFDHVGMPGHQETIADEYMWPAVSIPSSSP